MNFIWDSSGNKFSMTKRINRHYELTGMWVELKRDEIFCSNSEFQNLFNNQQTNTAISSQLLLAFPYLFWDSPTIRSYIFQTPITISIKTIVFYFFFGSIMTCRQNSCEFNQLFWYCTLWTFCIAKWQNLFHCRYVAKASESYRWYFWYIVCIDTEKIK